MKKKKNLDEVLSEVREIKKWRKSNNNSNVLNKDMLLWLLSKTIEQDGRIGTVEGRTKLLMWFFPVIITIIAIFKIA